MFKREPHSKLLADMPPNDSQHILCVSQPVVLELGQNFVATLKAQWLEL